MKTLPPRTPTSNANSLRPRSMVSPVNKSPTSRSRRNPQGIHYRPNWKTDDSPIQEAPHCSRGTTSRNDIPAIRNNGPLGDGDACRGRRLDRVRLPRDQSIIGLNGFLIVFSRSFRLILGLKLRHLRLLRTLRNRMRCSHSLPCRTKEHSDRHNKSHHRSTNPPQHSRRTHRDPSFEVIDPGQDTEYSCPRHSPQYTGWVNDASIIPLHTNTSHRTMHQRPTVPTMVSDGRFHTEFPTDPSRGRDNQNGHVLYVSYKSEAQLGAALTPGHPHSTADMRRQTLST